MSDVSVAEAQPEPAEATSNPLSFDDFPIAAEVREAIAELGYSKPTDVQAAVIKEAVTGRDMLVQSKTGSGKTSAFGIPMVERVAANGAEPGKPHGLVLAPTRELAHQVATELKNLAAKKGTRILAVYGGVPMGRQVTALKAGVDIVVATPGRLLDHIRRKNVSLEALRSVCLDEADEMLSMGFWDDVTELLKLGPADKQTMLFSATLPYEVAKAAAQFLKEVVKVDVSGDDLTVDGIDNAILHVLPQIPKPRQMLYILEGAHADSAIIFCNTRNETEMLSKYLTQSGFVAEPLSGNFKQKERERVMGRIKSGELRYMVATDIAARGIDINDLSHVFNYSLPEFSEVYLHRVGRTGRIGKLGKAISLVDGKGLGTLSQLERQFGVKFTEMKFPPEEEVIRARSQRIMKELAEKAAVAELGQHLPVAQDILAGQDAQKVVAFLLKSYFNSQADTSQRRSPVSQEGEPNERQEGESSGGGRGRRGRGRGGDRGERGERGGERGERNGSEHQQAEGRTHDEGGSSEGQEGDGPGRRRRRRRRGRGRGEGGESRVQGGGGGGRSLGFDVVDASELLGGPRSTPAPRAEADGNVAPDAPRSAPAAVPAPQHSAPAEAPADGLTRIRVNIGFDDGFKGRGAVAKKISALAGLNEGIVTEVESRRDHAVLKATPEIAEMILERVDGAQLGKKVIAVSLT